MTLSVFWFPICLFFWPERWFVSDEPPLMMYVWLVLYISGAWFVVERLIVCLPPCWSKWTLSLTSRYDYIVIELWTVYAKAEAWTQQMAVIAHLRRSEYLHSGYILFSSIDQTSGGLFQVENEMHVQTPKRIHDLWHGYTLCRDCYSCFSKFAISLKITAFLTERLR